MLCTDPCSHIVLHQSVCPRLLCALLFAHHGQERTLRKAFGKTLSEASSRPSRNLQSQKEGKNSAFKWTLKGPLRGPFPRLGPPGSRTTPARSSKGPPRTGCTPRGGSRRGPKPSWPECSKNAAFWNFMCKRSGPVCDTADCLINAI